MMTWARIIEYLSEIYMYACDPVITLLFKVYCSFYSKKWCIKVTYYFEEVTNEKERNTKTTMIIDAKLCMLSSWWKANQQICVHNDLSRLNTRLLKCLSPILEKRTLLKMKSIRNWTSRMAQILVTISSVATINEHY